jgi:hypothetical protein
VHSIDAAFQPEPQTAPQAWVAFLKWPIKKPGWFRDSQKNPNGRKPNDNHHCEEKNDAASSPIHTF